MQTRQPDTEHIDSQQPATPASRSARTRWLASIGAGLVVLAVIVGSVVVFALAGQNHSGQHNNPAGPTGGQWKAVEHGYYFYSISAVDTNSSLLYACATTSLISSSNATGQTTILRSANAGDTWQNIGANLLQGTTCQLAVNPSNGNDIYVFSGSGSSQSPGMLKHSTDGGKTWASIQPAITSATTGTTSLLTLQDLQFSGNTLYALGWSYSTKPIVEPSSVTALPPHLVKSSDGGHTWTIIDSQIVTQGLMARGFAVNPTDANTLYEMLGYPILPVQRVPPSGTPTPYGIYQQLYKTTDGGASWTPVLSNIPYASQVQIASGNPNIVYVGGVSGPIPVVAQGASSPQQTIPNRVAGFHLQVSTDGGLTWKTVAIPPDQQAIQNWFVSADGHVYTSPTVSSVQPGASGTGIEPTVIVGTVVPVQSTPFSSSVPTSQPPIESTPGPKPTQSHSQGVSQGQQGQTTINTAPSVTVPTPYPAVMQRYDLTSNQWSTVTTPPASGQFLAVTPLGANGGAVLWYMAITGSQSSQLTLYRYVD
jgi:hypothetical protein